VADVAGDSTGLESRYVSRYYAFRMGKRIRFPHCPKLSVVCDLRSHIFLSAKAARGPCHDMCEGPTILRQARRRSRLGEVLLDAGYDAERMHVLVREILGGRCIIPLKQGRGTRKWPKGRYRRMMKRQFPRQTYGQRPQADPALVDLDARGGR
jgi:hypothetical protein